MGASPMALLKVAALALLLGASVSAQAPTYGVGRTPTAEEIRAWDISIGPHGEELPPGKLGCAVGGASKRMKTAKFSMALTTGSPVTSSSSVTSFGTEAYWQFPSCSRSFGNNSLVMPISAL